MRHEQRITAVYDYPVHFLSGVFSTENTAFRDAVCRREPQRRQRLAFVVEARVAELWPGLLDDIARYCATHGLGIAGSPRVVPGGEECKNDSGAPLRLAEWFDALGLDRQSPVVIVGGGGLQDMAGYAAAITHRGLRTVRVPTTVLSQNDSGVGVKNGINAFGKKNFFGAFAPPFAVLADFAFLSTLAPRDKISGMAEAVKVALVKDATFFAWLEGNADRLAAFELDRVAELIRRCALLHLEHLATSGDPFELGSSRPLDFGHWAAHKLESLSDYSMRHGEAVAVGLALDTRYSVERNLLDAHDGERVVSLIEALGLSTWHPGLDLRHPSTGTRLVLDGIREFREHLGGDLTVMMLRGLGIGQEVSSLDAETVESAIEWLRARHSARRDSASRLRSGGPEPLERAEG